MNRRKVVVQFIFFAPLADTFALFAVKGFKAFDRKDRKEIPQSSQRTANTAPITPLGKRKGDSCVTQESDQIRRRRYFAA
jgi:hypothetical protein